MNYSKDLRDSLHQSFKNLISKQLIDYLCADCKRFRIFDPASTLYCFIFQVLNRCSCKVALLHFNCLKLKNNLKTSSMNSAAYSKAKAKLCPIKLKTIAAKMGESIISRTTIWSYKERKVFLGDGTIIELEDTKKYQKKIPNCHKIKSSMGASKNEVFLTF